MIKRPHLSGCGRLLCREVLLFGKNRINLFFRSLICNFGPQNENLGTIT